jgi:hypothetical protein
LRQKIKFHYRIEFSPLKLSFHCRHFCPQLRKLRVRMKSHASRPEFFKPAI